MEISEALQRVRLKAENLFLKRSALMKKVCMSVLFYAAFNILTQLTAAQSVNQNMILSDSLLSNYKITADKYPLVIYNPSNACTRLVVCNAEMLPDNWRTADLVVADKSEKQYLVQIDDLNNSGKVDGSDEIIFEVPLNEGVNIYYLRHNTENHSAMIMPCAAADANVQTSEFHAKVFKNALLGTVSTADDKSIFLRRQQMQLCMSGGITFPFADSLSSVIFSGPIRVTVLAQGKISVGGAAASKIDVVTQQATSAASGKADNNTPDIDIMVCSQITRGNIDSKWSWKWINPKPTSLDPFNVELSMDQSMTHGNLMAKLPRTKELSVVEFGNSPLSFATTSEKDSARWICVENANGQGLVILTGELQKYLHFGWYPQMNSLVLRTGWWNINAEPGFLSSQSLRFIPYTKRIQADSMRDQFIQPVQICGGTELKNLPIVSEARKKLDTLKYNDSQARKYIELPLSFSEKLAQLDKSITKNDSSNADIEQNAQTVIEASKQVLAYYQEYLSSAESALRKIVSETENKTQMQIAALNKEGLSTSTIEMNFGKQKINYGLAIRYLRIPRWEEYQASLVRADEFRSKGEQLLEKVKNEKIKSFNPSEPAKNPFFISTCSSGLLDSDKVKDPFELYADLGLKYMSFGLPVADICPESNDVNIKWFNEYLDKAKQKNIKMYPVVGTWEYEFPKWWLDIFGQYQSKNVQGKPEGGFQTWGLGTFEYGSDMKNLEWMSRYYKKWIPQIADSCVIEAWYANNEPYVGAGGYDDQSLNSFRNYLKQNYGDISNLNRQWSTKYAAFEEIKPPPTVVGLKTESLDSQRGLFYEWNYFRSLSLGLVNKYIAKAIYDADPQKRSVSPKVLSEGGMLGERYRQFGVDFWHFAGGPTGFWGNDNYTHGDLELPFMMNMMHSAGNGKPIVIGEAGTCLNMPPDYYNIPNKDQLIWWWDGTGQGLRGMFFFNGLNTHDNTPWSLLHNDTSPKDSLVYIAQMAQEYEALKPLLADATSPKPEVALIFPRATAIQHHELLDSLYGSFFKAWLSFYQTGISTDVISFEQFEKLKDYKVVVLSNTEYLEESLINPLQQYVNNGGLLLIEGICAKYNHLGSTTEAIKEFNKFSGSSLGLVSTSKSVKLNDVFDNGHKEIKLIESNKTVALNPQDADVQILAQYDDGKAAVTSIKRGKGFVISSGFTTSSINVESKTPYGTESWGKVVPIYANKPSILPTLAVKFGNIKPQLSWQGNANASLLYSKDNCPVIIVTNPEYETIEVQMECNDCNRSNATWYDLLTLESYKADDAGQWKMKMTSRSSRVLTPARENNLLKELNL
jgi:hypothetical protein